MPTVGANLVTGWLLLLAETHAPFVVSASGARVSVASDIDHVFATAGALHDATSRRSPMPSLRIGDDLIHDVVKMAKKPRKKKQVRRDGALPLAKRKLADALVGMNHRRLKPVVGDDGKIRNVWLASRYDELFDAIESARGGSGGKWNHQLPFWADAFVLIAEIDREVAKMHASPEGWKGWTPQRLVALEAKKWRPQDAGLISQHAKTLDMYNARIDQLFAPRPIGLPDPCPECQFEWVYRDTDGDDRPVRMRALQITENGCTCGNCKANWPIEHLQLLGKILERQRNIAEDDSSDIESAS